MQYLKVAFEAYDLVNLGTRVILGHKVGSIDAIRAS